MGGSHHKLKEEFPGLEQQIQLDDVMENEKIHQFFRQHFRAFLNYLEDTEPALTNHTGYMKKMHKHILKGLYKSCKSSSLTWNLRNALCYMFHKKAKQFKKEFFTGLKYVNQIAKYFPVISFH